MTDKERLTNLEDENIRLRAALMPFMKAAPFVIKECLKTDYSTDSQLVAWIPGVTANDFAVLYAAFSENEGEIR